MWAGGQQPAGGRGGSAASAAAALADSLGRRTSLLLDALPLLAGAALSATATSLRGLIAGRVLAGVGIGLASALVPLYISEVRARSLSLRSANHEAKPETPADVCAASAPASALDKSR